MEKKPKIYHGWWIVITCFLVMALQYPPNYTLVGLFVNPLKEEFNTTSTAVSVMITVCIMSSTVASFFVGRLFEKFKIRTLVLIACGILALSFWGMSISKSMMALYLFSIPRGIAGSCTTMIPLSMIINNWFGKKIRGKVISIAMIGSGIGAMVLSPITMSIINRFGWRQAFFLYGALAAVLLIPVALSFVQNPEDIGLTAIAAAPSDNQINTESKGSFVLTKKAHAFIYIFAFTAFLSISGMTQTWQNLGESYFESIGFLSMQAAAIISVTGFGNIVGKIIIGAVCDKWGARVGSVFAASELCVGCALLMAAFWMSKLAYAGAIFIGLGLGFVNVTIPLIVMELFGPKEYPKAIGPMHAAPSLGGSLLPLVLSLSLDATGDYRPVWGATCLFCIITIVCVLLCYKRASAKKSYIS